MKNTTKVQMKDLQVGDVVEVRYAEETVFSQIANITEDFQKNGTRIVILWKSNGNGIWQAKETTKINKVSTQLNIDKVLSKKLTSLIFNC
jgi:hypothetical protein